MDRPTAKMGFMADELYKSYLDGSLCDDVVIKASDKIGYYKDKMNADRINAVISTCTPYWECRK